MGKVTILEFDAFLRQILIGIIKIHYKKKKNCFRIIIALFNYTVIRVWVRKFLPLV